MLTTVRKTTRNVNRWQDKSDMRRRWCALVILDTQPRSLLTWTIRSLNQSLMPGTRWADCGNSIGARVAVKRLEDERGTMQPSTIATCVSPWACLSCAAKIRSQKAREIDALAKAHLAAGGGLTFITITFPHYLADSLEDSLTVVRKGWKSLVSGSGYTGKRDEVTGEWVGGAKNRWGVIGNVRAIEITDGDAHGWHPHLHVLCFHDAPLSPEDGSLQEFRARWSDRWARWVKRTLGRDIHTERGVDAVPVKDNAGLGYYVSKIHFELVRSDLKHGRWQNRTPWQIALDGGDGPSTLRSHGHGPAGRRLRARRPGALVVGVHGVFSETKCTAWSRGFWRRQPPDLGFLAVLMRLCSNP